MIFFASFLGEIGECLAPFNCGAEGGEPAGLCHQVYFLSER